MSDSEQETITEKLRDGVRYIVYTPGKEWKRRTPFGKLLYPLWIGKSIFIWIMATVAVFALAMFMAPRWINEGIDMIAAKLKAVIPAIHKEER